MQRARVLRAGSVPFEPLSRPMPDSKRAAIIRRERLEAQEAGQALLGEAIAKAQALLDEASAQLKELRATAEQEGYAAGIARAAAQAATVALKEEDLDQRQLERSVQIAQVLAERIVGRALELDEGVIEAMAQTALSEVRGARRVRFVVHPSQEERIRDALSKATQGPMVVEVASDAELGPGDFELHTDAGKLDASLGSRLEALSRVLSESLS